MTHIIIKPDPNCAVRIKQEQAMVLLFDQHGELLLNMPWGAAKEVSRQLYLCALQAEEHAKAQSIVMDQAILTRAGVPLGLSNRKDIQEEAGKEAAWNTELRRKMPGGVKSQEAVGIPAVIQHPPKHTEGDNNDG